MCLKSHRPSASSSSVTTIVVGVGRDTSRLVTMVGNLSAVITQALDVESAG